MEIKRWNGGMGFSSCKQQLCMGGMSTIIQSAPSKLLFLISSFLLTTVLSGYWQTLNFKKTKIYKGLLNFKICRSVRLLVILILALSKTNLLKFFQSIRQWFNFVVSTVDGSLSIFVSHYRLIKLTQQLKKNCIKSRKSKPNF